MNKTTEKTEAPHVPAWQPLRNRTFRALWIASFVSNIGGWMHEVGAAWLMTTLEPRPFMVGLIPAAANLAIFLLALPAGAVADAMDRRRVLVFTQSYLVFWTALLAVCTYENMVGPWMLISFTFLLALGNAVTWPAWQAMIPEMVKHEEVSAAIALGGIGFNLSRIVGPALGGFLVAKAGSGAVFLANSISFVGVLIVLLTWKRKPVERTLPEPVWSAVRTGMRYVRYSPELSAILVRTLGVIICGSPVWALLPLYARQDLGLDPTGYGVLLGWLGIGAVFGGLSLPRVRKHVSPNNVVMLGSIVIGLQLIALSQWRNPHLVHAAMLVGGFAWSSTMLSLNIGVLHQSPEWVRSRASAIYLLAFTGATVVGSTGWGGAAEHVGIPRSMLVAGVLMVASALPLALLRMPPEKAPDLSPSRHWHVHREGKSPAYDEGPILVTIAYCIEEVRDEEFNGLLKRLKLMRLRNGAYNWSILKDSNQAERYLESFWVENWAGHLRQHERMTMRDKALEDRIAGFHRGDAPPEVQHYLKGRVL